jgi:hypothetical protein
LETPIIVLLGRRSALDVSRCVFVANRIVGAASSGDNVQISWQAWHSNYPKMAEGQGPANKAGGRNFQVGEL